ncbi:PorT family protein [bacterium SCSIO 12643]|nr:PorT family protein [bacterium SCSIO 12643]
MKKVLFACLITLQSFTLLAQFGNGEEQKKLNYGISLGLNYSNILYEEFSPSVYTQVEPSNGMGFRFGIVADYKISKIISIAPKAELSFNGGEISVQHLSNGSIIGNKSYDIMPVSAEIMMHIVFKKGNKNWKPYFFMGPNVRLPLRQYNSSQTFKNNMDVALDFGIGGQRTFTTFHFLPELRYTFGLLDLAPDSRLESVNFHNISVIFSILG